MNYAEIIAKQRDGCALETKEIAFVVDGISKGSMSDAQIGAFAMAVLLRGMSDDNVLALTKAMRDSGDVLFWDVDGAVVDKHSTGGVGDCVSLALVPILACAGLFAPMISGRGLGHTGGTIDKLESMSGFSTALDIETMQTQLKAIGCVMASSSAKIAPADKRLYALRDITATVPSIPLITASILSKKLAAGLEHLVLDVKSGRGAFMKDGEQANELANKLVQVANSAGCQTRALITTMDIPLCRAAGNSLEVAEILSLLEGDLMQSRLYAITRRLCAELMESAGMKNAAALVDDIVTSGRALERFELMVAAQGGPKGLAAIRADMKTAPIIHPMRAKADQVFYGFDAYEIGMAVVMLGGGRRQMDDRLDHCVGISDISEPALLKKGDLLLHIHAQDESAALGVEKRLEMAMLESATDGALIREKVA